ncbi:hypothetical protein R5R35_001112 [Gryllus longicercus]|uniref:Uncharacterized protein n=1 Tax=Gryllus longicercus TaxID=2509291 RepID=A0AAN9VRZ7_9ORTH|nr:Uncharacterized protein GBIM_01743 [Gryllus bimaculatus]
MEEPIVSGLDAALHELGMLSSVTQSRREYLKEQQIRQCNVNRQALNVLHMNTSFVTVVDIGRRKTPSRRFKPYTLCSMREERMRTKSENSDVDADWFPKTSPTLTPVVSNTPDSSGLYKSRSLEDVKVTVSNETDYDNPTPEVESVSDQIQQLQVCE